MTEATTTIGRMILESSMPRVDRTYVTLPVTYYRGKPTYTIPMTYADVAKYSKVYAPEVQRPTDLVRVQEIMDTVVAMAGASDPSTMSDMVHLTVRKGKPVYMEDKQTITFNIAGANLSVNDGGHRITGIAAALDYMEEKWAAAPPDDADIILAQLQKLKNKILIVRLYVGLSIDEEKWLFRCLNYGQKEVAKSKQIAFDNVRPVAKMANEIAAQLENVGYKVLREKDRVSNGYDFTLNSLTQCIRFILFNKETPSVDKSFKADYAVTLDMLRQAFGILFGTPYAKGIIDKDKLSDGSLWLSSPSTIKGICKYLYFIRLKYPQDWLPYLRNLANINWDKEDAIWIYIDNRGGATHINQVYASLIENNRL